MTTFSIRVYLAVEILVELSAVKMTLLYPGYSGVIFTVCEKK